MKKKLITILAVLTILSIGCAQGTSSETYVRHSYPKFTMLDTGCGNTEEYTAQFVELDKTKLIEKEQAQYIYFLNAGTWLIEFEDGQKVYVSIYKGKPIVGGYVKQLLINYEEENK